MEANEIRIGNWIKEPIELGNNAVQVKRIETDKDGYSHYLDHCSPIPLTEEWLIKFGFEKISAKGFDSDYYHIKNGFGIYLHKSLTEDSFAYDDFGFRRPNGDRLWIDFVHQLQNLYFALTGLELHTGG